MQADVTEAGPDIEAASSERRRFSNATEEPLLPTPSASGPTGSSPTLSALTSQVRNFCFFVCVRYKPTSRRFNLAAYLLHFLSRDSVTVLRTRRRIANLLRPNAKQACVSSRFFTVRLYDVRFYDRKRPTVATQMPLNYQLLVVNLKIFLDKRDFHR